MQKEIGGTDMIHQNIPRFMKVGVNNKT